LEEEEEDDIVKVLEMAGEDEDALLVHIGDEEDSESNAVALEIDNTQKDGDGGPEKATITDKEFYKAMQKVKDRGTNAVPPKKSASAYILFGKEVSETFHNFITICHLVSKDISQDKVFTVPIFIRPK